MVDTIVALSSPPGTAGLAVVRLSGSRCREVVEKYLSRREMIPRHVYYGAFRDAEIIVDRLNFVLFPGPGSSTGEDVLELFPHGNMLIVENILRAVLKIDGVRLAEAGEFTRRSFENGKVDLLQAEAVGELIHAQTAEALKNAQKIVGGALSVPLKALRESLLDMSARLELDVDFSEEEADPDYSSWLPRMQKVFSALEKLANSFERGRGLARAPRVAILGAPNAGKSSLINALIEEDRLLVSNIPGTTRDYIDVPLRLAGGMIYLVDTAGLGKPVDGLDELAMARTRQQWQAADFKIWIEDGTKAEEKTGRNAEGNVYVTGYASVTGAPNLEGGEADFSLRVLTKFDLPKFIQRDGFLQVSSKSGEGLKEFRARLNAEVFSKVGSGEDPLLTTERQFQSIAAASERVKVALEQLQKKPAIEIIAFEIREAVNHLKGLLGEISSDEVLQKIFSGYCIGK